MNKADIKAPQLARARPFAAILSAETCDEFVRNEFEKIPRHFTQSRFADFGFGLEEFYDILLTHVWPKHLNFVANDTNKTSPDLRAKMLTDTDRLTPDKLRAVRSAKTTIALNRVSFFHRGLSDLVYQVNQSGLYKIAANAYYTPALSQGFLPHWDTHDVFILQYSGNKEWHLAGEPEIQAPLDRDEHRVTDGYQLDDETVLTLKPGEVLYIPRGFGHYAKALDTDSLHVTLGVTTFNWIDLLEKALDELALNNPEIRGAVSDYEMIGEIDERKLAELAKSMFCKMMDETDFQTLIDTILKQRAKKAQMDKGEIFGKNVKDLLK